MIRLDFKAKIFLRQRFFEEAIVSAVTKRQYDAIKNRENFLKAARNRRGWRPLLKSIGDYALNVIAGVVGVAAVSAIAGAFGYGAALPLSVIVGAGVAVGLATSASTNQSRRQREIKEFKSLAARDKNTRGDLPDPLPQELKLGLTATKAAPARANAATRQSPSIYPEVSLKPEAETRASPHVMSQEAAKIVADVLAESRGGASQNGGAKAQGPSDSPSRPVGTNRSRYERPAPRT